MWKKVNPISWYDVLSKIIESFENNNIDLKALDI